MQEEKGTTEDEMAGWHLQLDEHEFEQAPGVGDRQGSLACCSPWGRKESDTTERLIPFKNCESLCSIPEACIILYINHTSIKKFFKTYKCK